MASEFFNFIQTQAQTQTQIQSSQINNNDSQAEPGLFDKIITSLTDDINSDSSTQNPEQLQLIETPEQAFTGKNIFSNFTLQAGLFVSPKSESVIDILAGINNTQLNVDETQNLAEKILSDSGLIEQINLLPEETQQEILQAVNDLVNALQNSQENDIQAASEKLLEILNENLENSDSLSPEKFTMTDIISHITEKFNASKSDSKIEVHDSEKSNEDEDSEIKDDDDAQNLEVMSNLAGLQNAVNNNEINNSPVNEKSAKNETSQNLIAHTQTHKDSQVQQNQEVPAKTESDSNSEVKPAKNFDEVARDISNENESESEQNSLSQNGSNQSDSNSNNFTNARDNFSSSRNSSRTSNDSRKVSNNNQAEHTGNYTRTESHSSFQTFFEGILNSRRTVSQSSYTTPLNLRANLDFTPSVNLRDGVVNVIRFIRADGIQKANIVIDPPALGRISVELSSTSSGVEASIKVSSEQIRQLVQDQLTELRMNLSQQGVQVTSFTVDVQQDNQQGQGQNQQDNPQFIFNEADDDSDSENEEFRIDLEEGLLYWVA